MDKESKNEVNTKIIVSNFKLPFGEEYLRQKYNWEPIYSRLAVREYKRFLILALSSDQEVTPSLDVDEVWHTHILHTRSYLQFIKIIGRALHHDPGMPNARGEYQDQYLRTLALYQTTFNEAAPSTVWPRPVLSKDPALVSALRALDQHKEAA